MSLKQFFANLSGVQTSLYGEVPEIHPKRVPPQPGSEVRLKPFINFLVCRIHTFTRRSFGQLEEYEPESENSLAVVGAQR